MKKINWGLVAAILFSLLVWAAIGVASAKAAYSDTRLDAIASAIAGKPVTVSCGSDESDWTTTEKTAGYTFNVDGFTYVSRPTIYLSPRICDTIEADLHEGPTAVGDYWNGLAVKVFIHEATHQALASSDEGLVECQAFKNVRLYAPLFGYTKTVVQTTYAHVTKTTYKRVTKTVPNPALARLTHWASFWHNLLPASYRAVC